MLGFFVGVDFPKLISVQIIPQRTISAATSSHETISDDFLLLTP